MNFNVSFKEQNMQMPVKMRENNTGMNVIFKETQTVNGKDGLSAYEVAVQNGFEGTEHEWLETLKGEAGAPGRDGLPGKDGYTPIKGVDYFDGKDGQPGKPGRDGYTPVKGIDYFDGAPGEKGEPGYTPVKGKDYFDGKDGAPGQPGYTPIKGEDYFTESDKDELVGAVIDRLNSAEWTFTLSDGSTVVKKVLYK